jgi:hypothetical protein
MVQGSEVQGFWAQWFWVQRERCRVEGVRIKIEGGKVLKSEVGMRPSTSSGESKGERKVLRTRLRTLDYAAASLRDEGRGDRPNRHRRQVWITRDFEHFCKQEFFRLSSGLWHFPHAPLRQ